MFEPQASCLNEVSKKKREIASEVGMERSVMSRSKIERIIHKMGAAQAEEVEAKKRVLGSGSDGKGYS
jgi:hypothetical protein